MRTKQRVDFGREAKKGEADRQYTTSSQSICSVENVETEKPIGVKNIYIFCSFFFCYFCFVILFVFFSSPCFLFLPKTVYPIHPFLPSSHCVNRFSPT
uniref:Dauer-upregulated protein 191 n=1 Tax=Caenorhabditis elegans TaxID=6239 RepID=Q9Y043_CAEEL|nr:dauer-upregulated protein 191 [Caenorhabditis elegans]